MTHKIKALEMVRKIRDGPAKQLEGLSQDEQLAFYQKKIASAKKALASKSQEQSSWITP